MNKTKFSKRATILIILVAAFSAAVGCTDYPQDAVEDVEGVQSVYDLFDRYRKTKSESPDQMTIFLEGQKSETFHGLITEPIEKRKVQMHLAIEKPLLKDTYIECELADRSQVFEAKVGEHVTIKGGLSEFSGQQIRFTGCKILQNHSQQTT